MALGLGPRAAGMLGLELILYPRQALNLQSPCLNSQVAGMNGLCLKDWFDFHCL